MKSGRIAVFAAALATAGGIAYSFLQRNDATPANPVAEPTTAETSVEFMHVDDVAKNPNGFDGAITLRAVVAGVNEDEKAFAVIDAREYEACGVTSCARHVVPVVFGGELPKPKSLVTIKGHISGGDKGLVFKADSLQVVP